MPPHADADHPSLNIKTLPLAYDPANSEDSARKLLITLNPEWICSPGPIEFERFKDGITNTLLKGMKRRPGLSQHEVDQEAILLRAYGNGTAILIDREREAVSHSLLSKHSLAPALLARFDNGLLYRFIEGSPCSPSDLCRPDVWPATARRLGQWHGMLPVAEAIAPAGPQEKKWSNINRMLPGKPVPNIWTVMQKWIAALPNTSKIEQSRNAALQKELEFTTQRFGHTVGLDDGEYVMAHCDLLSANIIILPKTVEGSAGPTEVSFIDYEYTTPAPAAFDLANHFAEWIGFECNYAAIPPKAQRKAFIDEYISSFRSHAKRTLRAESEHDSDERQSQSREAEALFQEVDALRGMPGLYWGIWALIQAMISQIDFDYTSYADLRLKEYWDWKAAEEGVDCAEGQSQSLRERRWAQAC